MTQDYEKAIGVWIHKIGEIEHRLDKPQPRESSQAVGLPQNSDVDSSFMNYLKGGNVK